MVLIIFIAVSVIIFVFSYLGYKSKTKIKDFPKPKSEINKTPHHDPQVVKDSYQNPEPEEPNKEIKQNQLFEVFAPSTYEKDTLNSEQSPSKKSHSPKTLIIKPKSSYSN